MNYRLIFTSILTVLFLAAGPAWAAQPLGLNSFTANTPAIADSVNFNFTTLEKAVPVMWASIDQDPLGISPASFAVTTNSLNISTPDPGILLINGSVFVNNRNLNQEFYYLQLFIDGTTANGHNFLSAFLAGPDANPAADDIAEGFTLSYTYAYAVATTGAHTISQVIKPKAPTIYSYNKNNLTVIFFPDLKGGVPISDPGMPASSDTTSEDGN